MGFGSGLSERVAGDLKIAAEMVLLRHARWLGYLAFACPASGSMLNFRSEDKTGSTL